ncbi:hypothetical protein [Marinoscillum sp. MHG1-6]|uniref:hypothetical protein n=1 Tax=Marinoscillum sp. MHG1-6 TaxID=2959627 RepID=UPI0021588FCD|nr:hypothetical protein [Marinoscillum sp. MHG1-6]
MRGLVWIGLFMSLILICVHQTHAQGSTKERDFRDHMPTENLDPRKEANVHRNRPKRRNIQYLYKDEPDGTLFGNPCVLEQTRRMGFEYMPNPKGLPGAINDDDQYSNNVMVNLRLIVTHSPFWKLILNRRIKRCREKSGDWTG